MRNDNSIWSFFASVKLALFTLCSIALTSIIGTLIPQKEAAEFYIKKYGPNTAQFFQLFDIQDMYNSWWFLSLLGLLSANLIVCSLERFPRVWAQIKKDNLSIPLDRIEKMGNSHSFISSKSSEDTVTVLITLLKKYGWKAIHNKKDNTQLLFSQKNQWSRTGVYIVHSSILIIFIGAIIGHLTGFKGSIMLPEQQSSSTIYPYESGKPIELGFEIRCERFDIEFYQNNMPKEYRSKLTVLENGKQILQKDIEVNGPLKYKGITFYQSSYQGFRDFIITIAKEGSTDRTFTTSYQKEVILQEENLRLGVINLETVRDRVVRLKIWFSDGQGTPSQFWMDSGDQVKVKRADTTYLLSAKQRYATGLQVSKDPGVWVVYIGCGLMLLGLYMAFFMSHTRIWLVVKNNNSQTNVLLKGTTNKNKAGFEKAIIDLAENIRNNI